MPDKRKTPGSGMGSPQYAKRARSHYDDEDTGSGRASTVERPRNHPVYGQKSAFPGLDIAEGDELFYGPADDGMEYLRMVRSEANSLPFLFTAAPPTTPQTTQPPEKDTPENTQQTDKNEQEEEQESEARKVAPKGVYKDGVYVGPRDATAAHEESLEDAYSDAQATYYNLLHHRFLLLRSILKCTPPSAAIAVLDDSHPITFPRHSKNARKEWRRLLLAVDPQTVQLACMDMDSVLGVLGIMARLMSENFRSGNSERVRRIGAWAWGLLGKCRDIGQLGTEEVGEIRDLGKRAVKILHKMKEEEVLKSRGEADPPGDESDDEAGNEEGHGEDGDDGGDGAAAQAVEGADLDMPDEPTLGDGALEKAKARLQATLQDETEDQLPPNEAVPEIAETLTESDTVEVAVQTRAMLDMIITVVGEYFGQRDLLPARELWEVSET